MSKRRRKRLEAKKAKAGSQLKAPSIIATNSTQSENPIFCLCFLQRDFCLSKCNPEERCAFADTLHKLSQTTWAQIQSSNKHARGCEIIPRSSLKFVPPRHVTDDVPILAFRFFGKMPMLGYRDGRVFHVIALDRTHDAY